MEEGKIIKSDDGTRYLVINGEKHLIWEDEDVEHPDINGLKLTELMNKLGFKVLSIYFEKFLPEYGEKELSEDIMMTYVGLPGTGLEESEETVSIMSYGMDCNFSALSYIYKEKIEFDEAYVSVVLGMGSMPIIMWEIALVGDKSIESYGYKGIGGMHGKHVPNFTYRLAQEFFLD